MTDTAHTAQHPVDMLPELALGVLPENEAAPLRAHLEGCNECTAEYHQMVDVARVLPLAGEDVRLSPAVREGVMERIGREPRPITSKRAWRWQPAAIAAGVALLVAAGIGGGFALGNSLGNEKGASSTQQAESGLVAALINGSAQASHTQTGALQVTFVHAPGATSGFVTGKGLPPLPAGKAYEAWFSKDGTHMEPATVFTSESGTWIEAPGPIGQYVALGFTIEDKAGAKQPTTQPFALLNLKQGA